MARVVYIDDTYKAPNRTGPAQAEVYTLWVENPGGLDVVVYDVRQPKGVLAHDHSERRGYPLELPLAAQILGPSGTGSPSAWSEGIPLPSPPGGTSWITTPKPLGWQPFYLPGGTKELWVECMFLLPSPGTRTVTLQAQIRPQSEIGLSVGEGSGPVAQLTHTVTGVTRETRGAFHFTDLSSLGDGGLDRDGYVLEFWLTSDPPAATTYRLLTMLVVQGDPPSGSAHGEPLEYAPAKADLAPGDIQTGQIVTSPLVLRAHQRWNQESFEALGGAPGLHQDLDTPDETVPWRGVVRGDHQHRGRRITHPVTGDVISDGSVIRRLAWGCTYATNNLTTATYPRGLYLHQSGALDASWLSVEGRVEAPAGLSALFVDFCIAPGHTNQFCRLYFYLGLTDLSGANVPISLAIGGGISDPGQRSGTSTQILVDPIDGAVWMPNGSRQGLGLGLWTSAALRNPPPGGIYSATTTIPRVSRLVRFDFANTVTQSLRLSLKWVLETGELNSGSYATQASLLFVRCFYPGGF